MYGLSPLGIFHLAVSIVALASGAILLIRDKAIVSGNRLGQVYILTTIVTCISALGIYQHGGFGRAHVLAILTLIVLGVAFVAGRNMFGKASPYIETICYSATFLFHMIPGITEAATRLPYGAPLAAGPEEPALKAATGLLFLLFILGAVLQARRLKAA
ncbi:MAG: hypothetical protein K8S54_05940 [Spirochaetia bacterium]|nr:hypothetical protein [Spirochaetia bacterium]